MKVFALVGLKGGIGKTTSAISLAALQKHQGKKSLVIDMDPQAGASLSVGETINNGHILDAMVMGSAPPIIRETPYLDIVPANPSLADCDLRMATLVAREHRLDRILRKHLPYEYDFVWLDCPPSFNLLTLNALVACDAYFCPVEPAHLCVAGLASFMASVDEVIGSVNLQPGRKPVLGGIFATKVDNRIGATSEYLTALREHLGKRMLTTVIPINAPLAAAPEARKPIHAYDGSCPGARAYRALLVEIEKRKGIFKQ